MTTQTQPWLGTMVAGYDIPVINERAARAAAGILFLGGIIAYGIAIASDSPQALKPFGMFFILDMTVRLVLGDRWSPTLALGRLMVIRQKPEWVGARQKEFAWWLGFALATVSCSTMGLLTAPFWVTLALCGTCLAMLFLETAFGICVGCSLQKLFDKTPPQYCPGGSCDTSAMHTHNSPHTTTATLAP
jgi:Domain of unknown function (DUF4395)